MSNPARFAPLITSTDPQGRITYANKAFLSACDLELAQVVGEPHSIVRHPRMPARVFADMWASLKSGRPWTGLICNRSREGRDFWVKASVIPVRKRGATVGFTSVQLPAPADEIAHADRVYRLWQNGTGRGHVLRQGRIADVGWLALIKSISHPLDLPVQQRVQASAGVLGALFIAVLAGAAAPGAVASWLAPVGGWRMWALLGGGIGLVASAAVLAYFQTRIVRPLRLSLQTASAIASGEINRQFDDGVSAGELRDLNAALNQMVAKMAAVLRDSHEHADQVLARITELAESAGRLAQRSDDQSADVRTVADRTAASDALSVQVTDAAARASDAAALSTTAAEQACAMARTLQDSMGGIAGFVGRIGEISADIDALATQTGVLAMNAAAVAARDRELGRAFTVIANEVRSLAQRSGEASAQIKALAAQSRRDTEHGVSLAAQLGDRIEAATDRVRVVGVKVAQIGAAALAQSSGVHEINDRLRALDASTRENAALAQRSARGSASAIDEAGRLRAAIGVWHLD